jgi:hypothetical protein
MNKDAITVHAMFPTAHYQTHPSQTASHIHDADTVVLLARARTIAHAGCWMAGWRTGYAISDCKYSESRASRARFTGCTSLFLGFLRNAFTYVFSPPLASTTADVPSSAVKEWNTRPSESEIFSTTNLQPFESTLVSPPPSKPLIVHPAVPAQDRNQDWLDDPLQPPKKRMKVDVGPLDELIPLVHDPSSARSHFAHDKPSSLITFPPLWTRELHCLDLLQLISILRSRLFHP